MRGQFRTPLAPIPPQTACLLARVSCLLPAVYHSAHGGGAGSAARFAAVADELLDALAGVHFRRVDVAVAIHAHLMQPVEFADHAAAASQPAQLL